MKSRTAPPVKISASIHSEKRFRRSCAPFIIKCIIVLCGCFGSVFTFLSCIGLNVSAVKVSAAVLPACLVFTLIYSLRGKYYAAASCASAAVFIGAVFIKRYEICAGLAEVINAFAAVMHPEYRKKAYIYIAEPELSEHCTEAFVIFAAVFICAAAAFSTVRESSASGVFLATFIPPFSTLALGLEPNLAAFSALAVCWASMLSFEANAAARISDERCKKYSAYCGMYTAVISALCIAAVTFAVKHSGYERPEQLNIIYDDVVEYLHGGGMQQTINEIVTIATRNVVPNGAINHGRLGEYDDIYFDGKTVLEVTIPKSEETVYLRGFIGSVYTGNSWEDLSPQKLSELESMTDSFATEGLSHLLFDGFNLKYTRTEMPKYSFTVKNVAANNKYLYMPYDLVPESVSRYSANGGSGFLGDKPSYIGQFYDPKNYYGYQNLLRQKWTAASVLSADETAYRQFVYENYLDLPEGFAPETVFDESYYQYITAEDIKTGKSTLDEMTVFSRKLYFIKRWLRDNCEYSLSAGKLPAGKDFVDHFLENRKGSCTHFASAAAIMCRYAGIPARYVEGYVIKAADFPSEASVGSAAEVNVTDARGHAWVEVYLDGFGWYPVEFTSGYGNVRTAIPTETTVSETETETVSESEETVSSVTEAPAQETSPEQTVSNDHEVSVPSEAISETAPEASTAETLPPAEQTAEISAAEKPEEKPTVGFGAFGIKGKGKADIYYDLTRPIIILLLIIAVPLILTVRRRILLSNRRKTAVRSIKDSVLDDYRRFRVLLRLMEMPDLSDASAEEYIKALSERSPMLADGTAELVINSALKASFGGGIITRGEANEMKLAVNSLAKGCVSTLSRFGKFKLKFLYCII